jgi:hypothetical protein
MFELRASLPPTPGELAAMREVIALTEPQISAISALLATLNGRLENTAEEQRQLETELATRRQSLLEWTQSRDLLSKFLQSLNSRAQSRPYVAHICEKTANPTAMPSDDELTQRLVEEDNNDINAIRVSMDTRGSTIPLLRSRIAVLEEDIAGCKRVSSHTKSMMALQASHKDLLQDLLSQHKSRLHPLMLLPDVCLGDIFLHVVQLSWEEWGWVFDAFGVMNRITSYQSDPVFALTAVCHRWRTVATHLPDLWSRIIMLGSPTHAASRISHYVSLVKDRALCILTFPSWLEEGDIRSFEIIKSSTLKVDSLILGLLEDRYSIEQAMKVLPSPRHLILRDFREGHPPTPLLQELLSRTERLRALSCLVTTESTVPTLQSLELCLDTGTLAPPMTYIPSLLQNLPRLHSLSIKCQTAGSAPMNPQPASLLVSPGVCESVTHLEIPIMALCGPLKALRNVFTLPNLVRLSLLKFLQEGSDLQSWREFCLVNGGNINRLDLDAEPTELQKIRLSRRKPACKVTQHLRHLPGVKYLSLHACLVHLLVAALLLDVKRKGGDRLMAPNMKTFEINHVGKSVIRARFEEVLSSWNEARNIREKNEATGEHGIATVFWT